jgi:short-subunit dehydrogenase
MTKVVWITGASSGIGRAAVLAFIKQGYHVGGLARRADRLSELDQEIALLPTPKGEFLPIEGDVTRIADCDRAVRLLQEKWGRIDIVVVNAGMGQRGQVADADWHDLEMVMRLNMDGAMHTIRSVIPLMREQKSGHIMTISSVAATLVSPYAATYAATKAFLSSLINSLRIELASDNIKVSDFLVGRTETEFNEKRLGEGKRTASNLPTMSADTVAQALVHTAEHPKDTVVLRLFDRLILLGNRLLPALMGQLAKRQYK